MSEGRKTRRFKETNEKAELDRQWKKISAVSGRREARGGASAMQSPMGRLMEEALSDGQHCEGDSCRKSQEAYRSVNRQSECQE